ncbi:hypothetical protein AGMMS50255_1960 [Spirochaetia bacterium]|nr:hypothetical protein AGMMS50255_1960 [Spirochaetia bacterium]
MNSLTETKERRTAGDPSPKRDGVANGPALRLRFLWQSLGEAGAGPIQCLHRQLWQSLVEQPMSRCTSC